MGHRQLFINLCVSPLLLKMCEHFSLFFWNSRNKTVKEKNGVWFKDCFHRRPRTSWLLKMSKSSQGKGAGLTFQAQETASPKPSGTWSPQCVRESIIINSGTQCSGKYTYNYSYGMSTLCSHEGGAVKQAWSWTFQGLNTDSSSRPVSKTRFCYL